MEILSQGTDGCFSKVSIDLKYLKPKGKLRRGTEKIHCYQLDINLDLNRSKYSDNVCTKSMQVEKK